MENHMDFAITSRCEVFHCNILLNYSPNSAKFDVNIETPCYGWRTAQARAEHFSLTAMESKFINHEHLLSDSNN